MKPGFDKIGYVAVCIVLFVAVGYSADTITIRVSAPRMDVRDVPVRADLDMPAEASVGGKAVELRNAVTGDTVPGQFVAGDNGKVQLWWVITEAKAGQESEWIARIDPAVKKDWPVFAWKDTKGRRLDLLRQDRPVTRFMYEYDESSDQRRFETYKPFLHVYGINGQRLTNGPDGESEYIAKDILYPHHRGIFIGWNKLACNGKTYDLWHMKDCEQVCTGDFQLAAGPVLARSRAVVHWRDPQDKPLVVEQRTTTVYRQEDPISVLIDVESSLKAVVADVMLGGDPEHAGFQYRAHDAVAKGPDQGKAQYLFHEDGLDAHQAMDLPWAAVSYKLGMNTCSVLHMDHPDNPGPNKYSAYRDYARFGAFFVHRIPAGQTLTLRYRLWITHGPLTRSVCSARDAVFDAPLKATVTTR
ncbi:MAG: PmoA family protein [Sedimentisphaerales bacterium]|nr:PmoA family protein [Sedimentisphaerales bacterium]